MSEVAYYSPLPPRVRQFAAMRGIEVIEVIVQVPLILVLLVTALCTRSLPLVAVHSRIRVSMSTMTSTNVTTMPVLYQATRQQAQDEHRA